MYLTEAEDEHQKTKSRLVGKSIPVYEHTISRTFQVLNGTWT